MHKGTVVNSICLVLIAVMKLSTELNLTFSSFVYFIAIVSALIRTILWHLEKEECVHLLEHVR